MHTSPDRNSRGLDSKEEDQECEKSMRSVVDASMAADGQVLWEADEADAEFVIEGSPKAEPDGVEDDWLLI